MWKNWTEELDYLYWSLSATIHGGEEYDIIIKRIKELEND